MIDREAFVGRRRARWSRVEHLVLAGPKSGAEWADLASGYRAVCADLATARSMGIPADVQSYLDDLAGRAHNRLYSVRFGGLGGSILRDAITEFPRELRRQLAFFVLASVLFWGPFALGAVGAFASPEFAANVIPQSQLESMEQAYSGDMTRGFGGDASMAGFYVMNNVGIAFRAFATGVLFGLGSMFYLVYNGLVIGTVMGYLGSVGLGDTLLTFACGHGPWELTAVCVSGAAGLRMGWALIATGGLTRVGSLKAAGPSLYRLVLGMTLMLLVAAAIEGFWSAGPVPPVGKYVFAAIQ
ncbi:MAG: stage II sporulation protein M, partial [Myxococcota bacterium]